jgi:hypothetical protein
MIMDIHIVLRKMVNAYFLVLWPNTNVLYQNSCFCLNFIYNSAVFYTITFFFIVFQLLSYWQSCVLKIPIIFFYCVCNNWRTICNLNSDVNFNQILKILNCKSYNLVNCCDDYAVYSASTYKTECQMYWVMVR